MMVLSKETSHCDECRKRGKLVWVSSSFICADCLIKAYQLLNPPICDTGVAISDTTEFKGILDNVTDFHG